MRRPVGRWSSPRSSCQAASKESRASWPPRLRWNQGCQPAWAGKEVPYVSTARPRVSPSSVSSKVWVTRPSYGQGSARS
ncbi:hypothetical protein AN221_35630 [Streptomyces nanshensis]|uniref:Uncharacterized protein n=1 Tax=Streptomyces nanshensis TaxID=518642 RepID=A0A1E7LIX9_9ACTN|nr:hypothetical protein AN221_35630 [Streptomyces nanshensis]